MKTLCFTKYLNTKRSTILNLRLTQTLIEHYYLICHHLFKPTCVDKVRNKFWVPKLVVLVKQLSNDC